MTSSGGRITRSCLVCPGCPPRLRPDGVRGDAGLTCGPSDDGGFDEFVELSLSCASSSATCASSFGICATMASSAQIYAWTAGSSEAKSSTGSSGGIVTPICYKTHINAQGP